MRPFLNEYETASRIYLTVSDTFRIHFRMSQSKAAKGKTLPVRLTPALQVEVRAAAKASGLSQQDILRKATELGLPVFRRAMDRAMAEARGEIPTEAPAAVLAA